MGNRPTSSNPADVPGLADLAALAATLAGNDATGALERYLQGLRRWGFEVHYSKKQASASPTSLSHSELGHSELGLSELSLSDSPDSSSADRPKPWSVEKVRPEVQLIPPLGVPPEVENFAQSLLDVAVARVTDSERAEAAVERMRMLSSASFEGIAVHVGGVILDANLRFADMLGYDVSDLLGKGAVARCVAPEDIPDVARKLATGYEGTYQVSLVRKDGSRFRAELLSRQSRVGELPVRVVAVRDVTEQERTLEKLRQSEAHLRELADTAFDVTVYSVDGKIVEARGDSLRVIGYPPQDLVGRQLLEFVAPPSATAVHNSVSHKIETRYEVAGLHASGEIVPIEAIAVYSAVGDQSLRITGVRDLRPQYAAQKERRALEQRLERALRLESLGVLAGGIAHDFNNLLVGIMGHADLLLDDATDPETRSSLELILSAGQRAAELTQQMLAYAGRAALDSTEAVGIAAVLKDLDLLLSAALSKKAKLEIHVPSDHVVQAQKGMLTQVLVNLLANASDALEGDVGTIRVETRVETNPSGAWDDALGANIAPGNWIRIEVRDSGCGIPEATRARIFEPFFTTKRSGHGLGLASCVGIITALGGALRVESTPGQGSSFFVLLPSAEGAASAPLKVPQVAHAGGVTQPCRVLIVDDERVVRRQVRRSLELRGYQVWEAENGASGLAMLSEQQTDVILLDMTMPDMDGAEVVHRIRETGLRVPIVLTSGYAAAETYRKLAHGSVQGFLPKPYLVAELLTAIEHARAQPS